MHYSAELWEYYGLNYFDIWNLPASNFFSLLEAIEMERDRQKEDQRKRDRDNARRNAQQQ